MRIPKLSGNTYCDKQKKSNGLHLGRKVGGSPRLNKERKIVLSYSPTRRDIKWHADSRNIMAELNEL